MILFVGSCWHRPQPLVRMSWSEAIAPAGTAELAGLGKSPVRSWGDEINLSLSCFDLGNIT